MLDLAPLGTIAMLLLGAHAMLAALLAVIGVILAGCVGLARRVGTRSTRLESRGSTAAVARDRSRVHGAAARA